MNRRAIFLAIENRDEVNEMNDKKLKREIASPTEREALKVFGQVKIEKADAVGGNAQLKARMLRMRHRDIRRYFQRCSTI